MPWSHALDGGKRSSFLSFEADQNIHFMPVEMDKQQASSDFCIILSTGLQGDMVSAMFYAGRQMVQR